MKIEPRLSLPESHQSPGRRPNSGRDEGQRATFWAADSAKSSPAANSSARNAQSYIMLLEWRPCSTGPPFALQWLSGG
jgi:hypothetical protein